MGHLDTLYAPRRSTALPAPLRPRSARCRRPTDWVNVHTLGVKGDGQTDDTAAIQKAVDAHRVLYFPTGFYIVRDTIPLKPDTVLIALHPGMTQFDLPDPTPGYQGVGAPKAVLEAPRGGANIVSGLGIFTGAVNPRAVGILWMAGEDSLMDDVQFHGGAGGVLPAAVRTALLRRRRRAPARAAPAGRAGRAVPEPLGHARRRRHVRQHLDARHLRAGRLLRLRHDDAGTRLRAVERASPLQRDQARPRRELGLQRAADRGGRPTSPESVSLEIAGRRTSPSPTTTAIASRARTRRSPAAVRLYNSSDIHFRNVHVNAESGYGTCDENGCGTFLRVSKFPYENAIQDMTHHLEVREHEFAVIDVPADPAAPPAGRRLGRRGARAPRSNGWRAGSTPSPAPPWTRPARSTSSTDHQHRIFSWSHANGLDVVQSDPLDPVNLAVDKSGHLMVVSSAGHEGTVYSFRPGAPADEIAVLEPQASAPHAGAAVALPVNVWDNGEFANQLDLDTYEYTTLAQMFARDVDAPKAKEYVSPDGSLVLPAGRVFRQGPDDSYPGMDPTGWRWSNNLDAYGFVTALPGHRVYVSSASEDRTYRATVKPRRHAGRTSRPSPSAAARASRPTSRQRLRRQRPDLRLRPGRHGDRPDRRARAADRHPVRRTGSPHAVHPHPPHALCGQDARAGRAVALGPSLMRDLLLDVRYSLRGFRKSPAFTLVAVLSLALAIGANGFAFAVLDTVVLRPFEVRDPHSLYQIRYGPRMSGSNLTTSYPAFQDLRLRNTTFSDMIGIYAYSRGELGWHGARPKLSGIAVSGNYFDMLGVQPQIGRLFHAADERGLGSAPYVVLSDALWRGVFAGDPSVVGTTLRLDDQPFTVIGVAPASFHGTERFSWPDYWIPIVNNLGGSEYLRSRDGRAVLVIGRLKPGVTPQQATDDLNTITAQLAKEYPKTDKAVWVRLIRPGLLGDDGEGIRRFLYSVNAAGAPAAGGGLREPGQRLCRARGGSQPGAGVRVALGSSRLRLVRQLLTEALVIALIGGAAGLASARLLLAALNRWPASLAAGHAASGPGPGIRGCTSRAWP